MFRKQVEWFQGEPRDVPDDKIRQDHPYMKGKTSKISKTKRINLSTCVRNQFPNCR